MQLSSTVYLNLSSTLSIQQCLIENTFKKKSKNIFAFNLFIQFSESENVYRFLGVTLHFCKRSSLHRTFSDLRKLTDDPEDFPTNPRNMKSKPGASSRSVWITCDFTRIFGKSRDESAYFSRSLFHTVPNNMH